MNNPNNDPHYAIYRNLRAPRSLGESERGVEYACAISTYKNETEPTFISLAPKFVCIILGLFLLTFFSDHVSFLISSTTRSLTSSIW